jgi:hypothetical protein
VTTTFDEATRTAQDQFLAAVQQSQHAVVDAVAAWEQTVKEITPSVPSLPNGPELPKPQEVVDNAFDFAQKLLDAQRDFAQNVIAAAAPAIEQPRTSTAKKPA